MLNNSNKKILNSISLNIKQGEKICLIGKNGSGKTTLLRILAGLIHSNGSSIYINDEHYNKINIEQYRSQIGIITEGQSLFEGTIAENIAFKNPKISTEKLKLVLEKIKLTEVIKRMPKGLDEKILTEGKQLPSSLAQKILLARAIVNDPLVLFLENPFDKMDDDESKEIIDFILSKENNWTVIVTSKNDYWKEKCNRIITLDKGKLISDTK